MKWLVKKFNTVTGMPTDAYWNLSDIACFIDSDLGNDSTGDGTATAPWKTISKAASAGATYWASGKNIMINGIFNETLAIAVNVNLIGAGGINGRAVLGRGFAASSGVFSLHNIHTTGWIIEGTTANIAVGSGIFTAYNSLLENIYFSASTGTLRVFNCIFKRCTFAGSTSFTLTGHNNSIYSCVRTGGFIVSGQNNHMYPTVASSTTGLNNLTVDGQYLDPENNNFNFLNTSPLYRTGTSTLYGINKHVGAGSEGVLLDASSTALDSASGATYTNLTKQSTILSRTANGDGELETGIIDLGSIKNNTTVALNNTFTITDGVFKEVIQQSSGLTNRQGFDILMQYGETEAGVTTCPWLYIEYGKTVAVSGTGNSRVGNADPTFSESAYYFPKMRYCKLKIKFKTK